MSFGDCGSGREKVYLEAEDFGLDEGERFAVDFDETFALLNGWVFSCELLGMEVCERTLQCATAVAGTC